MDNKHMKRCSIIIREIEIKTTCNITAHLLEQLSSKRMQITNVGENVKKRNPIYTVGGNVNWCSHYGKQVSQKN